jgi:hypothetical protein
MIPAKRDDSGPCAILSNKNLEVIPDNVFLRNKHSFKWGLRPFNKSAGIQLSRRLPEENYASTF